MTRAEEKAVEYQIKTHGPNVMGGASMLSDEEYMRFNMNYDFKNGYEEAEKNLGWHPASEHPPVDEEVIVLTEVIYAGKKIDANWISFGHIVNTDLIVETEGKPYKVESFNGWNIPGVVWWMPMPKIPKEEKECQNSNDM